MFYFCTSQPSLSLKWDIDPTLLCSQKHSVSTICYRYPSHFSLLVAHHQSLCSDVLKKGIYLLTGYSFFLPNSHDISCETVNSPVCACHKTNIELVGHFKESLLKKSALINIYFYLQRNLEDPLYQNIGHSSQRIPMMYCKLCY